MALFADMIVAYSEQAQNVPITRKTRGCRVLSTKEENKIYEMYEGFLAHSTFMIDDWVIAVNVKYYQFNQREELSRTRRESGSILLFSIQNRLDGFREGEYEAVAILDGELLHVVKGRMHIPNDPGLLFDSGVEAMDVRHLNGESEPSTNKHIFAE